MDSSNIDMNFANNTIESFAATIDASKPNTTGTHPFIRQSFLRGHLAPAFPPPRRHCPSCHCAFAGIATHCVPCRKASALAPPKTYLSQCVQCKSRTLHVAPAVCVECCRVEGEGDVQMYCQECECVFDVVYMVKGVNGVLVCLVDVEVGCAKCGGLTDSLI